MLRTFLAAGAALTALATAMPTVAANPAPAEIVAPKIEFTEWTLDNGLRVIALPDPTTASVTTSVWYEVGSKNDPQGRSGFAHLFEHILSRKTENMPYNMINRLTEDVGGQRNASTGNDRTNYYETVPAEYLETMLWTHAERMARPVVDDEVFEKERSIVKEELRQRILAPPYGRIRMVLAENGFDMLPERRPGIGSIAELEFGNACRRSGISPGLLRTRHRDADCGRELRNAAAQGTGRHVLRRDSAASESDPRGHHRARNAAHRPA